MSKQWLSYADQVARLVDRGLAVEDEVGATEFLSRVNYGRL